MTGQEILDYLKKLAPKVRFGVTFSRDDNCRWDGNPEDDPSDTMCAYDTDVTAQVIINGEFKTGEAHLGGSWYTPDEFDIDMGGYLPQKLEEATQDLFDQGVNGGELRLYDVQFFLKKEMKQRWEAQQKEKLTRG